jgi:hypothetical protein
MVRRGRGRNTSAPRRFPQRKPVYAVLEDDLLGHGQQLLAQVTMVVGRSPGFFCSASRFYLDSVHIDLYAI